MSLTRTLWLQTVAATVHPQNAPPGAFLRFESASFSI